MKKLIYVNCHEGLENSCSIYVKIIINNNKTWIKIKYEK